MVLVDTTIWIDFFQHPASHNADKLEMLSRVITITGRCEHEWPCILLEKVSAVRCAEK
jgi:predicted nucleic acid-binding protein